MDNTPWIPYAPETLPKEGGHYLVYRCLWNNETFIAQPFKDGKFACLGALAYMEIPLIPQEFKLSE
jgi:hypothetical protein